MAILRSGVRTEGEGDEQQDVDMKCDDNSKRPMTRVIFVALLIDLLGFTLILPLFPALLEHYRQNDKEWIA